MSPPREPCVDFQLGLWKSTNSVGNINTGKLLQKSRKQFDSRRKRSQTGGSKKLYGYTSILIDLLSRMTISMSKVKLKNKYRQT